MTSTAQGGTIVRTVRKETHMYYVLTFVAGLLLGLALEPTVIKLLKKANASLAKKLQK